ncbi:hypothetical protein PSG83_08980 [Enterococcus faecium]|uniref:hypothetical protein n=1 Tax=Enterococcus faecium TaxID=1352 RepID=UPI002954F1F1|nr:hypothetical protein [Enterococcus faecium]EMF0319035.1 hypothetical protein [Enterococcus faecium]MDV7729826.1 hypothetical protein [Enterococcus faecium]MDV7859431.1 hypothetical protein [Enterococcus faecium]
MVPVEQSIPKKTGLIQSAKSIKTSEIAKKKSSRTTSKAFKNQYATIKLSKTIKEELELLMKLKNTKFTYETIDSYVVNELSNDEQRSFRTLKEFIIN